MIKLTQLLNEQAGKLAMQQAKLNLQRGAQDVARNVANQVNKTGNQLRINKAVKNPDFAKKQVDICSRTLDQIRSKSSSGDESVKVLKEYLIT